MKRTEQYPCSIKAGSKTCKCRLFDSVRRILLQKNLQTAKLLVQWNRKEVETMDYHKFLAAATKLKETGMSIRPILETNQILDADQLQRLCAVDAAVQTCEPRLIADCLGAGLTDLYFDCAHSSDETLSDLYGKCRFVTSSKAHIKQLDSIVAPFLKQGYLETVAIQLRNVAEETAFTPNNVPEFSRWIRLSQNLAVRGIFLDIEDDFSEKAKQSYSFIKKLRSDMPCLFTYFCFNGLLEPLSKGDEELLQTLKILDSLNDTSLYACFYIK